MAAWKLGRVAGIDVKLHWTFFLLLGWIAVSFAIEGQGLSSALWGCALVLSVFVCVVLHEFGHAFAAKPCGIKTRDITLLPIGGLARLDRMPRNPKHELWIAIAGPLVNVAIAVVLFGVLAIVSQGQPAVPESVVTGSLTGFLMILMWLNLAIFFFNLLPAFPMDGGRILRGLLGFFTSYQRATEIAAGAGQAMAILFAFAGLMFNPWLLLIALFVFVAAGAEASEVRFRELARHISVSEAMMTDFRTLSPDDSLSDAADALLAGSQHDFPVVDGQEIVGVLPRQTLFREIRDQNGYRPVREVMDKTTDSVPEESSLNDAVTRMREAQAPCLPVTSDGEIVGLLTRDNISELTMLRNGQSSRTREPERIVEQTS